MSLTLNLCTRHRPQLLARTIEQTLKNVTESSTVMLVNVDDDDELSYETAMTFYPDIAVSKRPREDSLGGKYNRALRIAPADVYMTMVDYAPIMTRGFDAMVMEATSIYPDGLSCAYGNLANLSFPSLQAVTHKLASKMGFIYPPFFPYWFIDHWLQDVVDMIERKVYVDVRVDCHSQRPASTLELRDCAFWATFYDACYPLRRDCALEIINSEEFEETAARKAAQRRNHELVTQHSTILNGIVRDNADGMQQARHATAPDARYNGIKAKAQGLLPKLIEVIAAERSAMQSDFHDPRRRAS